MASTTKPSDVTRSALALSPEGELYLHTPAEGEDAVAFLDDRVAKRVTDAFTKGAGHGVLHLGLTELASSLPPPFAWCRDIAKTFLSALCAIADIESQRPDVVVPVPGVDALLRFVDAVPPMVGAEYVARDVITNLWSETQAALRTSLAGHSGTVQSWLQSQSPVWNLVGRVCFHLAEKKNDVVHPFAFMATYVTGVSSAARAQHVPLGRALQEYAGARNRAALLNLLAPVQRATETSPFAKNMVDSGQIYHPVAWTAPQAHAFLKDLPALEAAGVVVRLPDWWNPTKPPRPRVQVSFGDAKTTSLGADSLLDFNVNVTLDGEALTADELAALRVSEAGLVRLRGKWVEVDPTKLGELLGHWQKLQKTAFAQGISFHEALRLLAGAPDAAPDAANDDEAEGKAWLDVRAGQWLAETLASLRDPARLGDVDLGSALKAELRGYQKVGVRWLWFLSRMGMGACLADDMGLGKTVQVIALLLLDRKHRAKGEGGTSLLVLPASLVGNWKAELERFAPSLRVMIAHPSVFDRELLKADLDAIEPRLADVDVVLTTYATVYRSPWLSAKRWNLLVLDEAQAIKNPGARQTKTIKALKSRARLALTGTPIENRLSDLWSLFDYLSPGLLGTTAAFKRFTRESGSYEPLRRLVRPYILRRLKSDRAVISDLPDKTEVRAWCSLTREQAKLYQASIDELDAALKSADEGIARKGVVLAFLMRFKQICNHPSQWLGDGVYDPTASGKFARLKEVCESIAGRQEKMLVFTQFKELTAPLAAWLEKCLGTRGVVLHGSTEVKRRAGLVETFQRDPSVGFFVLSLKAGGTGLNLTAARHVVHFDRWWNPAVEDQATDRAWRIGQKRNVLVHKFVCRGTVEERIDALITEKQELAREILMAPDKGSEHVLTEMSDADILRMVRLDLASALDEE